MAKKVEPPRLMEYHQIVRTEEAYDIEMDVCELIDAGWVLAGNLIVGPNDILMQPMARYIKEG